MSRFKMFQFKKPSKMDIYRHICNGFLVLLGSVLIAFGTAIFFTKLNIVAGGLSGIGIIFQNFLGDYGPGGQIIDIVVLIATWTLWLIGLIFIGKNFALKTLISSLFYPIALTLFLRIPAFQKIAEDICYYGISDPNAANLVVPIGNLLLCGIFGGVLVGSGVALTFLGGGSSGGVDVIIALLSKHTPLRESVSSFIIDGTIIIVGMFAIKDNVIPGLCGIASAFVTALMIETIYNKSQSSYQVDIISDKWADISDYAQNELERGATIIRAEGGYKGDERIILRVVFDKRQYAKLKDYIARTDPSAFVTFTQTNAVYGEGFKINRTKVITADRLLKRKKNNKKDKENG